MKNHCDFMGPGPKCPEECKPATFSDCGDVGILAKEMGLLLCQMTDKKIQEEIKKVITPEIIKNLNNPKKAEKTRKHLIGLVMKGLVSASPDDVERVFNNSLL